MKLENLPTGDHVVRYVKPSMIQDDGTADGSDFRLRSARPDETGLSVNWLQVFGPERVRQLSEVRRLSRIQLRPNGRFAEMNVGAIIHQVATELDSLRIIHDPLEATDIFDADPSHAEITGLPPGGSDHAVLVGDLIVECIIAMHPAVVEQEGSVALLPARRP